MKSFILIVAFLALSACASSKVNVDYDSCSERGKLDGVHVYRCNKADMVK